MSVVYLLFAYYMHYYLQLQHARSDATLFAYALILGILIYTINCFWLSFQYLVYIVDSVIRLWITTFSTLRSWSGNRNLFRVL